MIPSIVGPLCEVCLCNPCGCAVLRGAVLDALASSANHQLNVRTIARKLSIKPLQAWALLGQLCRAGKVERVVHKNIRETPTSTDWRLATQPQGRS